jgi:hypothetical protein
MFPILPFFEEFFFSQNGGGRGKSSYQPLQVQNPNFVDYPERSIVKRGCHSPHISRLQIIQRSVLLFRFMSDVQGESVRNAADSCRRRRGPLCCRCRLLAARSIYITSEKILTHPTPPGL